MTDRVALGVMARAPSDPRGKTRLVQALGLDDGTDLRRAMLMDTLHAVRPVSRADLLVLYTPGAARREMAGLGLDGARLVPQRGESLGERLEHAFADLFARGYAAVALIGSDLPTLPPGHVELGVRTLLAHPDSLVLGPADDGGYYLVGLRRPHPELFQDVPWSTPEVLARTRAIAADRRLPVSLLPPWYDVDLVPDLDRVLAQVDETPSSGGRSLHAWARRRGLAPPRASRQGGTPDSKDRA